MCRADVSGIFVTKPQPVTVVVGEDAKMLCQSDNETAVNWKVRLFSSAGEGERVCYNGEILSGHTNKYSINNDRTNKLYKAYNLVIHNAGSNDAGEYTCTEHAGIGLSASANLSVTSSGKDCISLPCSFVS